MFLKSNNYFFLFYRKLSVSVREEPLTVIKVPKYLSANLNELRHKERKKLEQLKKEQKEVKSSSAVTKQKVDTSVCVISSNNNKYKHYFGQTYRSDNIPLITKDWINGPRTNGHRMRFHVYGENPSKVISNGEDDDSAPTFRSLGLNRTICDAIELMGISEPTVIQKATIPSILDHKNIICSAETGSGKTIAYMAPIIQMIREFKELKKIQTTRGLPLGLVIVPSRELAEQVGRVAQYLGIHCGVGVSTMIGGLPKHLTHSGMDLIVSTIGLVRSLLQRRVYSLKDLNHLVVDESDTLFDDTFNSETLDLLSSVMIKENSVNLSDDEEEMPEELPEAKPSGVQLICVSATMPKILDETLGSVIDIDQNFERIHSGRLHHIMPHVTQDFYRIDRRERSTKLLELVLKDQRRGRPVMIFSNRSNSSNWIYHFLNDNGIQCLRLNKEVSDTDRLYQLEKFQSGECDVISCTDLGSRGLDTVRVRHVINYDCPHYVTDYIHRAGRTGRIGTSGQCLVSTFVSFKPDVFMVRQLETAIRLNKPLESIDDSFQKKFKNKNDFILK